MPRLLALVALCLLPLVSMGGDKPAEEGFVSLFNGKDLSGWKISEKAEWNVENGAIITPPQRSHLFTEKEYKDFIFRAEVMTTPGSNSGIYLHTQYEETFPTHGYECQINCTHGDPVKNGSLWGVVKSYDPIARDDEWYTVEIKVEGKNIQTRVNDKLVVDYTEPEGVSVPRRLSQGSFALQGHDPKSVVRYRNLRVKELGK